MGGWILDTRKRRIWLLPALLFSSLFLLYGILIAPDAGIQNDEALFAAPLYDHSALTWSKFGIPIMLLDYLGCLKTWIYRGIFRIWPPSAWSLRNSRNRDRSPVGLPLHRPAAPCRRDARRVDRRGTFSL